MKRLILLILAFSLILMNTENVIANLADDYYVHDTLDNATIAWNSSGFQHNTTSDYFYKQSIPGGGYASLWGNISNKQITLDTNLTAIIRLFYSRSNNVIIFGLGNDSVEIASSNYASLKPHIAGWLNIDTGNSIYKDSQAAGDVKCSNYLWRREGLYDIMIQSYNHFANMSWRLLPSNDTTQPLDDNYWQKENTCNITTAAGYNPVGSLGFTLKYYTNTNLENSTVWDFWYRYDGLTAPAPADLQYHDEVGNITTFWDTNDNILNSKWYYDNTQNYFSSFNNVDTNYINLYSTNRSYDIYKTGYNQSWYFRLFKTTGNGKDLEIGFSNNTIGNNNVLGDTWLFRFLWHPNGMFYMQFWNDTQYYDDVTLDFTSVRYIDLNIEIYNNSLKTYYKNLTAYDNVFSETGFTKFNGSKSFNYGYSSWGISNHSENPLYLRFSGYGGVTFQKLYDVWYYSTLLDPPPPDFINISAFDAFSNQTLKLLSVNIDGRINVSMNGSVLVNNAEMSNVLHYVIVDARDNDGYFTQTWNNINFSSDPNQIFSFNLTNARVNVSVNFNNGSILNFQVIINSTNVSTTNGTTDFKFSKGILDANISFDGTAATGYNYHQSITGNSTLFISISMITGFSVSCSGTAPNILIFNVWEENKTAQFLNSTIEYAVDFGNFNMVGNLSDEPDNLTVCYNATAGTLVIGDIYVKHYAQAAVGFVHRWYGYNLTLGNESVNVTLYNFNGTTEVSQLRITVRNRADYSFYSNVLTKLWRYYVSEGLWREVQHGLSDEFGLVQFDIQESVADYRLEYFDVYNHLLKRTDNFKFACDNQVCIFSTFVSPYSSGQNLSEIIYNISMDNVSGLLRVNWTNSVSENVLVNWVVRKSTMTSYVDICSNSSLAISGNYSCNISGYSGSVYYYLKRQGSNHSISAGSYDLPNWRLNEVLNSGSKRALGGFLAAILIISTFALGLWHPGAAVTFLSLGVLVVYSLGLFSGITSTFVVIVCVVSGILAVVVRKNG